MIYVVEFNSKEKKLTENLNLKQFFGFHIFNKNTDFYVKLDDLAGDMFGYHFKWCDKEIFLPNVKCYDPMKENYNGHLQTENIIKDCEKLGISCPACDYCVSKGGYFGTLEQMKLLIDLFSLLNYENSDYLLGWWSSSQNEEFFSWALTANYIGVTHFKNSTLTVIPFYDKI